MKRNTIYKWIIMLLCVALLCPQGLFMRPKEASAAVTGKVTATSLNIRSGPGTSYGKVRINGSDAFLRQNDKVTITEELKDWYKISFQFNGTPAKGYVKSEFIKLDGKAPGKSGDAAKDSAGSSSPKATPTPKVTPKATPTPKAQGENSSKTTLKVSATVIASTLNVRKKPEMTGAKVGSIIKNKKVTIIGETIKKSEKWYQITYNTTQGTFTGYVLSDYVKLSIQTNIHANINTVKAVKIRKGAGTKYSLLTNKKGVQIALPDGKFVAITEEVTDAKGVKWFQISFDLAQVRYSGYIPANQILLKPAANAAPTPKPQPTVTGKPDATPSVTPKVTVTPTPTPIGYIQEINTRTNGMLYYASVANVIKDVSSGMELLYDAAYTPIVLRQNEKVAILSTVRVNSVPWYYVEFTKSGMVYQGYVEAEYILVGEGGITDPGGSTPPAGGILSDAEFETKMTNDGFPESYKPYLRQLHQQYPTWVFETYHTGLNWNTVIQAESALGINLITNGKTNEWKSFDTGAYNWEKDSFIAFDGSSWVTASREAVSYYMDPRNFLTEKGIFQFELLAYQSEYQNATGVEGILYNTPLYNNRYSFIDDNGQNFDYSYSQTFIKAAEYSGVSPYHLASRVKQEVVTGVNSLSQSVTGTVKGYEGLYNFFNIGAYHSTAAGGSVANALKYARNGTTSAELNAQYLIPWDSPYDSIVGGAYSIGRNYISRGQDTIYLQKFNVTADSTYSHQYMANVQAPEAEAKKTFDAYSGMTSVPIVFSIPVYNDMPETVSSVPAPVSNPNNWLKTLAVKGYSLTPTFNISVDQPYSLIVDSSVSSVEVTAAAVSSKATVLGTGIITLQTGNNPVTVKVIAENGNIREYLINIVRE